MKKKPATSSRRSKAALAAAVLAIPLAGATEEASAQKRPPRGSVVRTPDTSSVSTLVKNVANKYPGAITIAGLDNGVVVYRSSKGELFTLDPATGDIRPVANISFKQGLNFEHKTAAGSAAVKVHANITIVGTDANGNVLHRTAGGELFYLDRKTGDMIFVK